MTEILDRKKLISDRIDRRLAEICRSVPPIEPEPANWLYSDASESFCDECVLPARGAEFDGFYPLRPSNFHRTTEWEEAFYEGIGVSIDGESDHTEACCKCGKTLSYILTEYGVENEISYFLTQPLAEVRDEDSYALDRLMLNIGWYSSRARLVDAAVIINQAWRIIQQRGDAA